MFSPAEIATNYISVAQKKVTLKWYKMLILGVLAGAFIAFGAATATGAAAGLSGWGSALVKGAVFPVGLILVVVCGAELFTGNCLLISPAIGKHIKVRHLFKSWGIVYAGNLIGGVLLAVLVVYSGVLGTCKFVGDELSGSASAIACITAAANKCNMGFGEALLRGILCNMLVCLAVWAAMSSKHTAGKILALYFPVLAFVVCGFEHSIANMYYLTAGLLAEAANGLAIEGLTVGNALLYCLLPSTIGNIIGGGLIALAYHAVYLTKVKVKKQPETTAEQTQTEKADPVQNEAAPTEEK